MEGVKLGLIVTGAVSLLIGGAIIADRFSESDVAVVSGTFRLGEERVYEVNLSPLSFTPDPDINPSLPEPILRAHNSTGGVIQESRKEQGIATGSSFYIGHGLWFTNRHVALDVGKDSRQYIRMANGTILDAQIVCVNPGEEATGDFALMMTKDPGVPALKISSSLPKIGDEIFSSGYPKGAREIVRSTRVQEVGTQIEDTQVPELIVGGTNYISSGNSGSPALNLKGEVVGVNTFGRNADGAGIAIGSPSILKFLSQVAAGEICAGG